MAGFIRITGLDEGLALINQMRDAAGRFTGTLVTIGSPLIYSYGVNYGRTRGGRLARKAGPSYYLEGGLQAAEDQAKSIIAAALPKGPGAVDAAAAQLGEIARNRAQEIVPVRSGRLRNSIVSRPR